MNSSIKNYALNLLSRREHSQAELRTKLITKKFDSIDISALLQLLSNEGIQSDKRFTESYVRMRSNHGYGPLRIKSELRERGINEEIINEAMNLGDEFWMQNAQKIWHKKFGNKIVASFQERSKQLRFLQYKGYNSEQIKYVLKGER